MEAVRDLAQQHTLSRKQHVMPQTIGSGSASLTADALAPDNSTNNANRTRHPVLSFLGVGLIVCLKRFASSRRCSIGG